MTKARTEAQKIREKKARAAMLAAQADMGLSPTPKREPNGRAQRETADKEGKERDPSRGPLDIRARRNGLDQTDEGRRKVAHQSYGGQVGSALHIKFGEEKAKELHRTYTDWLAADAAYCRRYLGQGRYPKCAGIEAVNSSPPTEAKSKTIDIRSEEERDRAVVSTWMRWNGYLGRMPAAQARIIQHAESEALVVYSAEGKGAPKLTRAGELFTRGIARLADVVAAQG